METIVQGLKTRGLNTVGMTMILRYVVRSGFILPVNVPQNMVTFGTDTFEAKDCIQSGIPLAIAAYLLILLLGATYRRWLGLV